MSEGWRWHDSLTVDTDGREVRVRNGHVDMRMSPDVARDLADNLRIAAKAARRNEEIADA